MRFAAQSRVYVWEYGVTGRMLRFIAFFGFFALYGSHKAFCEEDGESEQGLDLATVAENGLNKTAVCKVGGLVLPYLGAIMILVLIITSGLLSYKGRSKVHPRQRRRVRT